jgi:2-polyprenyl-3-methyl-5-hydroxy-6-metoxy-1,4-benzoquinol methylase
MKETIGNVVLNYDFYTGNDEYSDGDSESELLDIVKNHEPSEYNEIISKRKSWPILYHLSKERENVLEWYPFDKEDSILEIGSGCGALSGMFARKGKSLTCIELSKRRSLINAYRNRNEKIEIIVGNFQNIEPNIKEKYDIITLIGVLEYAGFFIKGDKPYEEFLKIIKKHLNPSGKIIVAIENKYGLKYWAGCKEDHVSAYYEGIEGYTHAKSIRTFSKNHLERLAASCQLKIDDFYYPYPDYKLPTMIYSDQYLPKIGELNNNIRNFDNDRIVNFNEAKAFDSIIEDDLFPVFTNSYLIIMSEDL